MIKKNNYTPQVHPVTDNMPLEPQVSRLLGKLNIAVKEVEKEPDKEPEYEVLILDGNSNISNVGSIKNSVRIMDGNS